MLKHTPETKASKLLREQGSEWMIRQIGQFTRETFVNFTIKDPIERRRVFDWLKNTLNEEINKS